MKKEPVVSAVRRARLEFNKTDKGKLWALRENRAKWRRRLTIAQNKLEEANSAIVEFAHALCQKGAK